MRTPPRFPWVLLVLTLAGCAASAPAPVEERGGAGARSAGVDTAPAGPAQSPPREPDGSAPSTVTVIPLESGPGPAPAQSAPPGQAPAATPEATPPAVTAAANPAVVMLLNRANRDARAGRHDNAAASLERALKIEPSNAWLWHRLAATRLDQGRLGEAASLAARSNSLAAGDDDLQAGNWRLIARVHRLRGEEVAARAAEDRARRLSAPRS